MKKIITFIICIVLVLGSVPVYASSEEGSTGYETTWDFPSNYNEMTEDQKIYYWKSKSPNGRSNWQNYIDYNTGAYWQYQNDFLYDDGGAGAFSTLTLPTFINALNEWPSIPEYLAQNISYDSGTEELSNSEDLQLTINNMISNYNEQSTYIQGYMPGASMLDPTPFTYASVYKFVKNTIANNPDFYFYIERDIYTGNLLITGTNISPLGGVSAKANWRNERIYASVYNDDWSQDFEKDSAGSWAMCCISAQQRGDSHVTYTYCEGLTSSYSWVFSEEKTATTAGVDMSDFLNPEITSDNVATIKPTFNQSNTRFMGYGLFRDPADIATLYSNGQLGYGGSDICWHGASNYWSIDIYNTIGDLKRGNVGVKQASYMPNYTGTAPSAVSASYGSIVNNYITSGGTGSGTGGSGSGTGSGSGSGSDDGGSGSGWLDSIINGLGSVGNAILTIVGSVIEWIGKAIEFITDSLGDITDLVTGNTFSDFLAEVFPYVPEEIWTGVLLCLALLMFGGLIRFFRG